MGGAMYRTTLAALLFCGLFCHTAAVAAPCAPPPPAVRDITANNYYTDPAHHSVIDPARFAANRASVAPIESYLRRIAVMASTPDATNRACAVQWLAAWATDMALTGTLSSEQAAYERKWTLAGLALSYAKVRDGATLSQRAAIDGWLITLARQVARHADHHKGTRNNHYYWEGLAVAAAGVVTGDATATDWGREVFRFAMGQIGDDGALTAEMGRGRRALHYHLFAAEPLVMLAAVLNVPSARLDALVALCIRGLNQPETFTGLTGIAQEIPPEGDHDWLQIYNRHRPGVVPPALLPPPGRSPFVTRLGGDIATPSPLEQFRPAG